MKLAPQICVAVFGAVALTGCSNTTSPVVDDLVVDDDLALVASDAALEDLQQMVVPTLAPLALQGAPPTDVSRTVTFFDIDGVEQNAYDPVTTASIRIVATMSGDVQRGGWTASITRSRDMTVSGLEGQETSHTWNGTGSGSISQSRHTDDQAIRTYEMTTSSVVDNVVRGLPRESNPWPLSGSITRTIMATMTMGDQTRTVERMVVITFNGTQFATLTVGDETFEVDLAAREGDRPQHRP